MENKEKWLNKFWYMFYGGLTPKDIFPIIFTVMWLSVIWCLILTIIFIRSIYGI